jgi:hypothetical protein
MLRSILTFSLALGIAIAPAGALAEGTLAFAPDAAWATPVSDDEMSELRGGFDGLAFNIAFTGFIDSLGNVDGNFAYGPEGVFPSDSPEFDFSNGDALISTQIGNFQGFSGIAQIVVAPGNFNFIQNNLFIQIVMNGVPDSGTPTSIFLGGLH